MKMDILDVIRAWGDKASREELIEALSKKTFRIIRKILFDKLKRKQKQHNREADQRFKISSEVRPEEREFLK